MPQLWVQMDQASYLRALHLLEGVERATLDLTPAWHEISTLLRAREVLVLAKAAGKAGKSKAPSHARYVHRKAMGWVLNGRGERAAPGAGPLTVTGRIHEALIRPQTLQIRPLEMHMGVRVRDAAGKFAGDVGYIVPLQKRFGLSRRPSLQERNDLSQVILRRIERSISPSAAV